MKIVIIGYGKMGKAINSEAQKLSILVSKIINNRDELISYTFQDQEVAIDFTEPLEFIKNIKILTSKQVNTVCGTTGWFNSISQVQELVLKSNIGLIYSPNFSIGVNIFWKIIKSASAIINQFEDYDVIGHEIHHKNKKDSPSGTLLTTAQIVIDNIKRKNKIVTDSINKPIHPELLHLKSSRCGTSTGIHKIIFDSVDDYIKISHHAKNRRAYAHGAIKCAQWIKNKRGFYNIDSFINEIINV